MRGKRSKAYRKLLKQYALAFHFREPWQVLVDADLIKDAHRFTMDLPQYLANTLHGEVKILVTQCSMRHLYAQNKDGGLERLIDQAKGFERRRCGHHPDQHPTPLSTAACLASVVGPANKHRYVVASQDHEVRAHFRRIAGVPLVYISRSVMIVSDSFCRGRGGRERERLGRKCTVVLLTDLAGTARANGPCHCEGCPEGRARQVPS